MTGRVDTYLYAHVFMSSSTGTDPIVRCAEKVDPTPAARLAI